MGRVRTVRIEELDLPARLTEDHPKGDQLRELLEALAVRLGAKAAMPSDRQLAEHFGVARMTVRNEVRRLVDDGILTVRGGSGTFVADTPKTPFEWGASYSTSLRAWEVEPRSRILENTVLRAAGRVARMLEIDEESPVLRLVRLRILDDEPIGIERVFLPLDRFPGLQDLDLEHDSLYQSLASGFGVLAASATGSAAAVLPTEEEARLLDIRASEPCVLVTMTSRDVSDVVFETGRSLYRGDRYEVGLSHDLRAFSSS